MNKLFFPRARRSLLGIALIALPALAQAAPTVALWPESPAAGQPFQVELLGEWAAACVPSVADSWVEDDEVIVKLRDSEKNCAGQPTAATVLRTPSSAPLSTDRDGTLRIRVLGGKPERTLAFGLAAVGDVELYIPESGLWWPEQGGEFDTSGPGLGVQIEVQGDALALNLSGYDAAGSPFWWFAAGESQALPQSLSLTALKGGSGPFAKYAAPNDAMAGGSLHIEWLSSARAVFWFVRADAQLDGGLDVRPMSMTRFAFGLRPGQSWQGDWILSRRDSAGLISANALRFDQLLPAEDGFVLSGDGFALRCLSVSRRPDSPPESCFLSSDNGDLLGQFGDVGLKRMQGLSSEGDRVRLTKLDDGF